MLTSAVCNCICLVLIATLSSQVGNILAAHGAIVFIFLYHISYVNGFGGIPYLYAAELSPLHLRSTINSISVSASWGFSILITNVTPMAFSSIGQRYFYVFAGLNALIAPIVFLFYPETSGRSLEEIDDIFALSTNIFDTVKVAKKLPHIQQSFGEVLPSQTKVETILKEKEIEV